MDKFGNYSDDKNYPLCRFGPGGSFISDWPADKTRTTDPIGKVLQTIAKFIGAVTDELLTKDKTAQNGFCLPDGILLIDMEDEIDFSQPVQPDAKTTAVVKTDSKLPKEQLLFDNDTGIGKPAGNKQNHGVRAHRRAKRKRTSFSSVWQGSLFEPNFAGPATA
jgi:hypothetical protein